MMEDRAIMENEENAECEIVKEVREIRHKISARFDHDVGRLVAHYQEMQEQMRQSGKYKFAELPNEDLKISESADTETKATPMLNYLTKSNNGSVVVYKASFEKGVLKDLAAAFPEHASTLQSIIDRLWDQLVIFQKHYMHPGFLNSNSLKAVLPILVPSLGYENLDVQDGLEAQAVWNLMLNTTNEEEKNDMIENLKAYCKLVVCHI